MYERRVCPPNVSLGPALGVPLVLLGRLSFSFPTTYQESPLSLLFGTDRDIISILELIVVSTYFTVREGVLRSLWSCWTLW
ncbi:hypothetical protein EV356DRAFT_193982 [Viridothelium virens]|uniref:Uncharacterized protein n=1 Tax=Viridothelium virens TaxID=1048519 RepID=A0A6A6H6R9_VIRVR|nr:hypothetical protein EV356DRAFT_193982 [Viridothelium virens]